MPVDFKGIEFLSIMIEYPKYFLNRIVINYEVNFWSEKCLDFE